MNIPFTAYEQQLVIVDRTDSATTTGEIPNLLKEGWRIVGIERLPNICTGGHVSTTAFRSDMAVVLER